MSDAATMVSSGTEDAFNTGIITSRMKALNQPAALSILIVDDDEIELALIGDQLEARGFDVVRASSGRDALALMDSRFFSVLLTDCQMPGMDGVGLTERVRARGMSETYIIMLTKRDATFDYERGYAAGVDDYLSKSNPNVELHARINAAFGTAALRCSLRDTRTALAALPQADPASDHSIASPKALLKGPDTAGLKAADEDWETTTQILALPAMHMPSVLIVDDDELILARLKLLILEAGYEVFTAASGDAALAALQKKFMSIVVVDRNMPGMDGLALCRAIRQRTWTGYVYLMVLTAHDAEEEVLLGLRAGADDYVSKRASEAQLIARLATATRILTLEYSLKIALADRRRLALTDPLTGANNRRYFMRYFGAELKRARRFGMELSLLSLDVDHFKQVNDSFGHAAGDAVLKQVVETLQRNLPREYDWCARLGGEEFAVVLPQTDLAGAAVVAEKLRKAIEEMPSCTAAGKRPVTVSIGVSGLQAMPAPNATTIAMVLAHADQCLYKSKAAGRNCVTLPRLDAVEVHPTR
jgi:two-component system, cell cycle response regulator